MNVEPISDIAGRFRANLSRVRGLAMAVNPAASGGSSAPALAPGVRSDMLRAAVILLHAALEDLLRSVEGRWWRTAALPENLRGLTLVHPVHPPSSRPGEKFHLGDLSPWRGRTVDEVFEHAIASHLDHTTYNDVAQVRACMDKVGMDRQTWHGLDIGGLEAMIKRRHKIAHRADVGFSPTPGPALPQSIEHDEVSHWIDIVDRLGQRVLSYERERGAP